MSDIKDLAQHMDTLQHGCFNVTRQMRAKLLILREYVATLPQLFSLALLAMHTARQWTAAAAVQAVRAAPGAKRKTESRVPSGRVPSKPNREFNLPIVRTHRLRVCFFMHPLTHHSNIIP